MSIQTPVDKAGPLWLAWEAYKSTPEYANTRNWALDDHHVDGSLWAAFERGFAASRDTLVSPAPPKCLICKERDGNVLVCAECIVDVSNELLAHPLVSPAPETDNCDVRSSWDLSPCPFCGKVGMVCRSPVSDDGYWVRCAQCHAEGPERLTQHEAVAAWNRASEVMAPPPPAVDLEAIKARLIQLQAAERSHDVWANADVAALVGEIERLRWEIGLTHERLDELDQHGPLCDWLPDLVDECYRKNTLIRERDALRAEIERLQALAPEPKK